ncbi:hypothetical protein A9Q94_13640 [Rhodobacterales bacterium 56_14_T64]|nr:hypothetical protein A9Q94_13640 [Rhodobacterales bacterium 56_14_T64]
MLPRGDKQFLETPWYGSRLSLGTLPRNTLPGSEWRGKGRLLDNIFIERLWHSMKYECVYLHAWESGSDAKVGVKEWMEFYKRKRPHSALDGKPLAVVY